MDNKYIKVEGSNSLYRDKETGAIIDFGQSEYNAYISQRQRRINEKNEFDRMKNDIEEIKSLLKEFLNR
jgi:hypothetical protein